MTGSEMAGPSCSPTQELHASVHDQAGNNGRHRARVREAGRQDHRCLGRSRFGSCKVAGGHQEFGEVSVLGEGSTWSIEANLNIRIDGEGALKIGAGGTVPNRRRAPHDYRRGQVRVDDDADRALFGGTR